MNDNPRDFDNDRIEHCDACDSKQMGTEWYANDAMGMATPVLWNCHRCANPPLLVGLWRHLKVIVRLRYGKIKYRLTTTAEERAKREAHRQSVKDRINARRKERGEPLIGESMANVEKVTFLSVYRNWRTS
jgi:hypothetical protein